MVGNNQRVDIDLVTPEPSPGPQVITNDMERMNEQEVTRSRPPSVGREEPPPAPPQIETSKIQLLHVTQSRRLLRFTLEFTKRTIHPEMGLEPNPIRPVERIYWEHEDSTLSFNLVGTLLVFFKKKSSFIVSAFHFSEF